MAAFLCQQPRVGDAVGDVVGLQRGAAQRPDHGQCGCTGVDVDEILRPDQVCRGLRDAALLPDGKRLLGGHRRLIGQKLAVRQGRTAVDLIQTALPRQLGQVAADRGFTGVKCLAQLLHGGGAFFRQQVQDQGKAFLG